MSAVILHATLCIACWLVGLELLIGGGAGLCSLVVELIIGGGAGLCSLVVELITVSGAGLCSLVVELVCAHWWWSWSVLIGGGADHC